MSKRNTVLSEALSRALPDLMFRFDATRQPSELLARQRRIPEQAIDNLRDTRAALQIELSGARSSLRSLLAALDELQEALGTPTPERLSAALISSLDALHEAGFWSADSTSSDTGGEVRLET